MRCALTFLALLTFASLANAATRNNDDSCDIAVMPAATLLLPYFEVDLDDPNGATTLFTITNASAEAQIARVTLWTDHSFPVVYLYVYLTGYDVQSINLYDVLVRGIVGTTQGTGPDVSHKGEFSTANERIDVSGCTQLPGGPLDKVHTDLFRAAFTQGIVPASDHQGCTGIGGKHANAVGYATIDVVRSCILGSFTPPDFIENLLWDNVLLGDTMQIDRSRNFAEGSPMVHIRAVPEGGTLAQRRNDPQYAVKFPRTFYDNFSAQMVKTIDGRQPLPSIFAAHYNTYDGETTMKIWRQPVSSINLRCAEYRQNFRDIYETVGFDEEENAEGRAPQYIILPIEMDMPAPSTSISSVKNSALFPRLYTGAGWMFIDLGSQVWVVTSMRAEGRFSVDMDAIAMGNGCSAPPDATEVNYYPGQPIGPLP